MIYIYEYGGKGGQVKYETSKLHIKSVETHLCNTSFGHNTITRCLYYETNRHQASF